jgi:hypothetical protein
MESPQQSYATFAAHHARMHTPTRLVFVWPATDASLLMARERVTDALYDFNMPMKTLARWLAYIEDAAPDMTVDEVWAWAILDWSELIIALDDDDVLHAFVDMSHALYARGMECDLDDAILDAFKEAHIAVAQTLASKSGHAKLNKMLKSWWSASPPTIISNGNLANGNPLLGHHGSDAAIAYPNYQRSFYRCVLTQAWQVATERRLEAVVDRTSIVYVNSMEAIAEEPSVVDVDTQEDDVDSGCTVFSFTAAAPLVDAPVAMNPSSAVAKWPMEPLPTEEVGWSVMELVSVVPAVVHYRPSWLERSAPVTVEGDISCDLGESLISQRRTSDADSLCSLTTIPFSDVDEDDYDESLASPIPTAKSLEAPLDDWIGWSIVTNKEEPSKPDSIAMMDESLRVHVFTDETEGIEHEFNRLVCEIKRRRLIV